MIHLRQASLPIALLSLLVVGSFFGGCATKPLLLKKLPQSRNDLFPQTGSCPAQFAFLHEDGIVVVQNHIESSYSPIKGVKALIALPKACNHNLTLWYSGESVHLYDAIVGPVLEALKENDRQFNASVVEMEGQRVFPEDRGGDFVIIRVPVPVKEPDVQCLDDAPAPSQSEAPNFFEGDTFRSIQVRYFFSYGQLVVLVPKAKNKPAPPDEGTCIARWKTSPALAKIPRTQLPVVLESDEEKEIAPRRPKQNITVTDFFLE